MIWPTSAQTATQHAVSLVQYHWQLIENHLVPQSLSMKTNGPSNAGVGANGCGVEIGKQVLLFFPYTRREAKGYATFDDRSPMIDGR